MVEVYILHSNTLQKYYVGFSKQSSARLNQHRKEKTHWTSRANDWVLVWKSTVSTTGDARSLEKKIKARGAKRFLIDLTSETENHATKE